MPPLRFVHAADLHLDSPFRGMEEAPPAIAARLRQATFEAFEEIVDLCIAEKVDALLVAGDVYDESDVRLQAQLHFVQGLKRLDGAGIRSFVCHGNHDPLGGWSAGLDLPPSCHRFGAEVEAVPVDPARPAWAMVHGMSYPVKEVRENLASRFQRDPAARLNIGLLHANVGTNTGHENYAPCTIDDLARTGMDYWALGHVHQRRVLKDAGPAIVYPGNPQGRHVNEPGPRGVYLVELPEAGAPALSFRETSTVRWEDVHVRIDGIEREQELLDALFAALDRARRGAPGKDIVCRVALMGRGSLHRWLARGDTVETLRAHLNQVALERPFCFCGRIEDQTRPPWDREELGRGEDIAGEVVRRVDAALAEPGSLAVLGESLRDLYDHFELRRHLGGVPGENELRELLAEAEARALDELLAGAE